MIPHLKTFSNALINYIREFLTPKGCILLNNVRNTYVYMFTCICTCIHEDGSCFLSVNSQRRNPCTKEAIMYEREVKNHQRPYSLTTTWPKKPVVLKGVVRSLQEDYGF